MSDNAAQDQTAQNDGAQNRSHSAPNSSELEPMLVKYLKDAHAMEQNVLHMLTSMIVNTSDDEIKKGLEAHKEETRVQAERITARLQAHGQSVSPIREAGAIMSALTKGVGDAVRKEKAGKNARDAFVTEHLEIAAYELLERLAIKAGDEETASVARQNRAEEEEMARLIADNWDRFLELTLEEEGLVS
jgi:ferritin-like metal-binding protein YciE